MEVTEEKIRLDKYISDHSDYSRNLVINMIKNNSILVNGVPAKASYKVHIGDIITIKELPRLDEEITPWDYPVEVIYEDEYLMIINKPSGMTVHPGSGNHNHTLVNALIAHTKNLSDVNGLERLGIVHRIDKDTSGIIVVAKTNKAHEVLAEGFKNHTIKREYLALLCGVLPHDNVTIDAPIGRDVTNRLRMCVTPTNSKKAITHLKVLKRYKEYTLIKARLETGRTHQIRVHTKYIGYPVYNDPVYTNKECSEFGQFLHSYSIELNHPITNEKLVFTAELPPYFQDFLDKLETEEKN